jgi:hypothetical protein
MNSEAFKNIITLKRPRYAKSRIPVIEAFANKGKSKSEYSQFGPIYELYIYAFILGLKKKMHLPLPTRNLTTDFLEIGKWKSGSSLVDFLMMILFTHCDEIGFNWNELEDMDEKELNNTVNNIITCIESYANGGLEFLQTEYEQNNLINSPYLFVDLLGENSTFLEDEETNNLEVEDADEDIVKSTKKLISFGESPNTEFKSSLRVCFKANEPKDYIEHSCMKTIAGFMNTKSGSLLIGVADDKEVIGLDKDLNSFTSKDDLMDKFQTHLDNVIGKYLGNSAFSLIKVSFPELEGKLICRLDVSFRKSRPIYLKNKEKNTEEFYVRRSASTISLSPSEMISYIENHWN